MLLPGKSHGWRSLEGCSPWGLEESDTTDRLHFHALEKEMATHSSVLAWRIPGTGQPGRLPSMGLHRVRHDWSDLAAAAFLFTSVFVCLHLPVFSLRRIVRLIYACIFLDQCCPNDLSVTIQMFCICSIQYGNHWPYVFFVHLKCVICLRNGILKVFDFHVSKQHV